MLLHYINIGSKDPGNAYSHTELKGILSVLDQNLDNGDYVYMYEIKSMSEWSGLTSFISSLDLCTTVHGCQICCNWSRLKAGINLPAHWGTMPQINVTPHPVTLNWCWANQLWSRTLIVNANQGSSRYQFFSLWLDLTGDLNPWPFTHGTRN